MGDSPADRPVQKLWSLNKSYAWAAGITVVIANAAAFISNIEKIQQFIFNIFGLYHSLIFHTWFKWFLVIGMLLAYSVLALYVYWTYFQTKEKRLRLTYCALAVLCGFGICALNLGLVQARQPAAGPLLRQASVSLSRAVLLQQTPNGGFRFWQVGPNTETQVWTTAQCLFAVLSASKAQNTEQIKTTNVKTTNDVTESAQAIRAAFDYVERLRLPAGGGWGYMEGLDWAVTEIIAWVALAKQASLYSGNRAAIWPEPEAAKIVQSLARDLTLLIERQHDDGGWSPIHKTNDASHLRTYSTAIALWALIEARQNKDLPEDLAKKLDQSIARGARWLLGTYHIYPDGDGGWLANPSHRESVERFVGLTAQTLFILSQAEARYDFLKTNFNYQGMKKRFLVSAVGDKGTPSSLLFRDISTNERVHDSDRYLRGTSYTAESSTFLWYPWSLVLASVLNEDSLLDDLSRAHASTLLRAILNRSEGMIRFVQRDPVIYPTAENLFSISFFLQRNAVKNVRS